MVSDGGTTSPAATAANCIALVDLSSLFAGSPASPLADIADVDTSIVQELAERVRAACETTGCFYLSGVDSLLPRAFLDPVYATVRAFFALPKDTKLLSKTNGNTIGRGYFPFETENVNAFMGRAGFPDDPVEKYGIGPVDPCPDREYLSAHPAAAEWWASNIWPKEPADFQRLVADYYRTMAHLAEIVMTLFSVALGMDPDFMRQHFNNGAHSLKINYYPVVCRPKKNQLRLPEHTDAPPFTLLTMDETKDSLKVRTRDGNWIFVNPIPGAVFVNVGDTMARWTNDRWAATPHQVVWPEGEPKDRISMAFFAVPNYDTKLTCVPSCLKEGEEPHYPPMTLQEYVMDKCRSMATGSPAMM